MIDIYICEDIQEQREKFIRYVESKILIEEYDMKLKIATRDPEEIIEQCPDVDYVFIAVSSGGTVAGISQAIHEYNKSIKVIAVDVEGSKIFEPETKKIKHFTGIGSSIRTDNFLRAIIDDKIIVSEHDSVQALFNMMRKEQLFLGGSSGCVVTGTDQYLQLHKIANKKIVVVSHDRGDRYFANLYSKHPEFMD